MPKRDSINCPNERFIEDLADFEYHFRDGMVFDDEQKERIKVLCEQIIGLCNE